MKYYVSYVLNRKNANPHRFNHGSGNNNKEAYNSLNEIKKDILRCIMVIMQVVKRQEK